MRLGKRRKSSSNETNRHLARCLLEFTGEHDQHIHPRSQTLLCIKTSQFHVEPISQTDIMINKHQYALRITHQMVSVQWPPYYIL